MSKSKKAADMFLRVLSGAFVTFQKPPSGTAQMLFKIAGDRCEDVVGMTFTDLQAVESCIAALNRCRDELLKTKFVEVSPDVH
jgi:hypothetical protein